jgi:hypothetical protein
LCWHGKRRRCTCVSRWLAIKIQRVSQSGEAGTRVVSLSLALIINNASLFHVMYKSFLISSVAVERLALFDGYSLMCW